MKAVSCLQGALSVVDMPTPQPARGPITARRAALRYLRVRYARAGPMPTNSRMPWPQSDTTTPFAVTPLPFWATSSAERFWSVVAGSAKEFKPGTTVVSFPLLRAHGGVHLTGLSPLAPGGVRRTGAGRGIDEFRRAQRPRRRHRRADRADGGGAACRAAQRHRQAGRRGGHRLRTGRAGRHLPPQGPGRGDRSSPATSRPAVGRWRRGAVPTWWSTRPTTRPMTARRQEGRASPRPRALRTRHRLDGEAAQAARLGAPVPRRGQAGRGRTQAAGDLRMRRRAGHDRRRRRRGAVERRGSWSSGSAWARTGYGPPWRSARRSTCGSSSATRHWNSATPCYLLADGKVDASALVTGTVGLDGVDAAFDALGDPEKHAKILIDPRSAAVLP